MMPPSALASTTAGSVGATIAAATTTTAAPKILIAEPPNPCKACNGNGGNGNTGGHARHGKAAATPIPAAPIRVAGGSQWSGYAERIESGAASCAPTRAEPHGAIASRRSGIPERFPADRPAERRSGEPLAVAKPIWCWI
jgi:hypothetical protein